MDVQEIDAEIRRLEAEYDRLDHSGVDTAPISIEIGVLYARKEELESQAADAWPSDTPFQQAVSRESLACALAESLEELGIRVRTSALVRSVLALTNQHLFDAVLVVREGDCRLIGFDTRSCRRIEIPASAEVYLRAIYAPGTTRRCSWVPILYEAAQRYADRHAQAIGVQYEEPHTVHEGVRGQGRACQARPASGGVGTRSQTGLGVCEP